MEDEKKKKRSKKKNKQTKQAEDIACGANEKRWRKRKEMKICVLRFFKKEWFQCKNGLDIGCNSGIITIQIAKKFQCRSILGIDIDCSKILIIPEFF
ncbi:hypothetical protein Patl1_20474 [Pistacia atlantica]|uniref:Uncharacterized protein n=1 Tax=Pistacia atlantica TaxID=434234 RepID=A0ACC1BJ67_9ROSI|nr:hypothetical protein Patl1_20474 [Pistacia atlantica]